MTTEFDHVANKEYRSWHDMADYTSISKSILDRWIYCNQEEIARRTVAMYRELPSDGNIHNLIEEYKLCKITPKKMANLWEPPSVRMKRQTSAGKMPKSNLAETEVFREESKGDPALNPALINLIIGQVADRGRVVWATKIIEKGTHVCNFDGLLLEPDACNALFEKPVQCSKQNRYYHLLSIPKAPRSMYR